MKREGFFRRILAKIRREKKGEKKKKKGKFKAQVQPSHPLIRHGKKFKTDEKKLKHLEKKVSELAKKHNVPQKEIEEHTKKIETRKVISKAHELPKLEEIEKRVLNAGGAGEEKDGGKIAENAEEVKAIAVELHKHRIVTDFDRVLSMVQQKGKTSVTQLSVELGVGKKIAEECCAVLEESGLIEIIYPALGSPVIEDTGFEAKRKEEIARKKAEKKAKSREKKSKGEK